MRSTAVALMLVAVAGLAVAEPSPTIQWGFEDASVGKLSEGWSSAKTGEGPGSVWKIIEDKTAPSGKHVLAQTSAEGPRPLFNLCVLDEGTYAEVQITVSFKAVAGKIDRGGGPVWRYQDANNYYICRQNPLENNFRIYKVIDGKRAQLASLDVKADAGKWHTIKVTMQGEQIVCSINDKELMARDGTIKKAGKVGLWTKADAVTHFDNFRIQVAE
jgi:hypothetical protein